MSETGSSIKVVKTSIPLTTIGFITWIVFMILDYGCKVDWLRQYNPHPHFWTWFPLWAPWALAAVIYLIVFILAIIIVAIEERS